MKGKIKENKKKSKISKKKPQTVIIQLNKGSAEVRVKAGEK